jgi:hypothetical protein
MMSLLGACWNRPILGKREEVLKGLEQCREVGEHTGKREKKRWK